jgi:FkbM family methyltransferase
VSAYGQLPEIRLLARLVSVLDGGRAIDVGAERGEFVHAIVAAGALEVHALEPEPANLKALFERFEGDGRVRVHGVAVSSIDEELTLHLASGKDGTRLSFGHTVLERPNTDQIGWYDAIRVPARSLGSLVSSGELPPSVALVKIDAEGHDLAVIDGMGALQCDLLMTEPWIDLPSSLGPCPWTAQEMIEAAAARGFSEFAFFHHWGELTLLQWNDATTHVGSMGNFLFIHDRVRDQVWPSLLSCASELAVAVAELADERSREASDRLTVIDDLKREVRLQANAAAERLAVLEQLHREPD